MPPTRFHGPRINCESVPRLPARLVAWALDDPRKLPYVLRWYREERIRYGVADLVEALTVSRDGGYPEERTLLAREAGSAISVAVFRQPAAFGGSVPLLVCEGCGRPKQYLYAWERQGYRALRSWRWPCRQCAGLRFASEGHGRNAFGPYPRFPWEPYVFSSPARAANRKGWEAAVIAAHRRTLRAQLSPSLRARRSPARPMSARAQAVAV